jgi:putative transposase
VQNRRDKAAARRFFRRLMKKSRPVPRVIVTDKLRSYDAAHREVMPSVEHRQSKYLNNRAENTHQPTRQRERAMKSFRSVGGAQRFLSAFSGVSLHFRHHRHLMTAPDYRAEMSLRFTIWEQITGAAAGPSRPDHRPGSQALPRRAVRQSHTQQRDNPVRTVSPSGPAGWADRRLRHFEP